MSERPGNDHKSRINYRNEQTFTSKQTYENRCINKHARFVYVKYFLGQYSYLFSSNWAHCRDVFLNKPFQC
jgi:hypothetical protein